jgi:hypothetical protein
MVAKLSKPKEHKLTNTHYATDFFKTNTDTHLDMLRNACDGTGGRASHWFTCTVIRLLIMDNTLFSISWTWLLTSFSTASNWLTPLILRYGCCCVWWCTSNITVNCNSTGKNIILSFNWLVDFILVDLDFRQCDGRMEEVAQWGGSQFVLIAKYH